ncbi:MAG: hypothetical protein Fur0020_10120 [Thermodesulfovibrionia bacterium]
MKRIQDDFLNPEFSGMYRLGSLIINISSDHEIALFNDRNLSIFKVSQVTVPGGEVTVSDGGCADEPHISFFISSFKQDEIDRHTALVSGRWHHNVGMPDRSILLPDSLIRMFEPIINDVISRDDGSLYMLSEAYLFSAYMKERTAYLSYNSSLIEGSHLKFMTMLAIRQFLEQFDAIMLHASSIVVDGMALLFSGPSGIGKSTVIRLLNMPMLSDDYVLIQRDGNRFIAHSTPFGKECGAGNKGGVSNSGLTSPQEPAEVGAIYYLMQDDGLSIRRLRHDEALSYSIHSDSNLMHHLCYNVRGFQFNFLFDMFQQVPVYEMRFKNERIDINSLRLGALNW